MTITANLSSTPPLQNSGPSHASHSRAPEASPTAAASAAVSGDQALTQLYANSLLKASSGRYHAGIPDEFITNIPANSTYGQWQEHLSTLLKSPDLTQWAKRNDVDLSQRTTFYTPPRWKPGFMVASVKGDVKQFGGDARRDQMLPASWYLLMEAATKLAAGQVRLHVPTQNAANLSQIAAFYGETLPDTQEGLASRASSLKEQQVFPQLTDAAKDALDHQKRELGAIQNKHSAASALKSVAAQLAGNTGASPALDDLLRAARMDVHPNSWAGMPNAEGKVSLADFILLNGWDMPANLEQLNNLERSLSTPAPVQAPLGNLGGALSWPVPIEHSELSRLNTGLMENAEHPEPLLDYLMRHRITDSAQTSTPQQIIENMLESPKAKALGEVLRVRYGGYATSSDLLLAVLGEQLEPASTVRAHNPSEQAARMVAGFDLASPKLAGMHATEIVTAFINHLVQTKRATTETAPVAAHLLLARHAPALLAKDIPDKLTYGSHSWVSFVTAAALRDSKAAGSTAQSTYAQVMAYADIGPISKQERIIEQDAQGAALRDWALANGLLKPSASGRYTETQISEVYTQYNNQIREFSKASQHFDEPIPNLKQSVLTWLKQHCGETIDYEKKCLLLSGYHPDFPGPYSIYDLVAKNLLLDPPQNLKGENHPPNRWYVKRNVDFPLQDVLNAARASKIPDFSAQFNTQIKRHVDNFIESIPVLTRYMLTRLPDEDKRLIEYGEIDIYREELIYKEQIDVGILHKAQPDNNKPLLLRAKSGDKTVFYEVNPQRGEIFKRDDLQGNFVVGKLGNLRVYERYPSDQPIAVAKYSNLAPEARFITHLQHFNASPDKGTPNTYASARTASIVNAVHSNVIDGQRDIMVAAARGVTTLDTEVPNYKKIQEFFLNLIPFRSAIVNFAKGDISGGLVDLSFDVFGFLTAGAAVGGKAAKAFKAARTLGKVGIFAKAVGRTAFDVINPLSGVFGSAAGAMRKTLNSATDLSSGIKLANTDSVYDLIKPSKQYPTSALGTFKHEGKLVESSGVLVDGQWYLFDAASRKHYGKPLSDFQPSIRVNEGELGSWENIVTPLTPESELVRKQWSDLITQTRNGPNKALFDNGFNNISPEGVAGFRPTMKSEDVMKLALEKPRTPEQLGALARQQERIAVKHSFNGASIFSEDVSSVGGTLIPVPQVLYFSQVNPLSRGQCAAMSRVMADAIAQGKELVLIGNIFEAAANPASAASRKFISSLSDVQKQVHTPTVFHAGKKPRAMTPQDIVQELSDSSTSKTLMISTPDHSMTAGVIGEGATRKFFFYDPNFGLATFSNADQMSRGMQKIVNNKKLPVQYKTHGNTNTLEFQVSVYDDKWTNTASLHKKRVTELYDAPLSNAGNTPVVKKPVLADKPPSPEIAFVPENDSITISDRSTILQTRGISDCTAIVLLSDLTDGVYAKRTLMHLRGSSLNPLQSSALRQAQTSLADGSAKLIVVGGERAKSPYAIAVTLRQEHNGETLLRDWVTARPNSITITTASGVDIKPDGTFNLIEGIEPTKTFTERQKKEVFDFID